MTSQNRPFNSLAGIVRQARLNKGMTQRNLSRTLGMSEGYVGHLEGGRIRPNVKTLKSLSEVLGLVYSEIAVKSGYITRNELESPINDHQLKRLNEVNELTDDEWKFVREFTRYIRSRRHNGKTER